MEGGDLTVASTAASSDRSGYREMPYGSDEPGKKNVCEKNSRRKEWRYSPDPQRGKDQFFQNI